MAKERFKVDAEPYLVPRFFLACRPAGPLAAGPPFRGGPWRGPPFRRPGKQPVRPPLSEIVKHRPAGGGTCAKALGDGGAQAIRGTSYSSVSRTSPVKRLFLRHTPHDYYPLFSLKIARQPVFPVKIARSGTRGRQMAVPFETMLKRKRYRKVASP